MNDSLNLVLLAVMTLLGSLGGVNFKLSSGSRHRLKFLLLGMLCYGTGALINIYLLSKLDYTVVFLANSLTFVWALVFARWVFRERIGWAKLAGVVLILAGVSLLV
ncbi:EamA family transporter [Paenibacillus tarimensis]|uniref:EamA family transporter n=1 Tax=Paenibacillus tarimensis TaxID=416012 RepID=UPI001F3C4702|nr:EamA family transporter [Paenibacillus tarimensis]MCF2943140.1 EamA family transporter [Paenibacillus tarimensis]